MTIKIHIYLFLMMAYMYASGNLKWFLCYYAFTIMHEIAHILMALSLKVDMQEVILLPIGVNAKYSSYLSPWKELLISLAGPLASFLFALFFREKTYSMMNLLIGIFNLIPLYPMDGGRIIRSFLNIFFSKNITMKICNTIAKTLLVILLLTGIILVAYFKNYYIVILILYIFTITSEELKKEKYFGLFNYLQKEE